MLKVERNLWKEGEIKALLNIIDEENILQLIKEKKYRSEQIFRFVESEMCSRGFTKKNHQQIWTKWKFLKSSYVTTRRHNSVPGNARRSCDYYTLLDKILSNQPEIIAMTGGSNSNNESDNENNSLELSLENHDSVIIKQEPVEVEETIEPRNNMLPLPKLQPISQMSIQNHSIFENQQNFEQLPSLQQTISPNNGTQKRKRSRLRSNIAEASYPDLIETESDKINDNPGPSQPKKSNSQSNYLRAIKDLAVNLRQMQKELITDFFRKQEELMREEHEFQRQQDELLLRSVEEQTKLLLDSARNLLTSNVSISPDVVYLNED